MGKAGDRMEFVQSDWGHARPGFQPRLDSLRRSSGTLACAYQNVSQTLAEAFDYLAERDGLVFDFNW